MPEQDVPIQTMNHWSKPITKGDPLNPCLICHLSNYLCRASHFNLHKIWPCIHVLNMHRLILPHCLHPLQPPDVTAHPDDDTLCALLRDIKVLSAGHLSPLSCSTSAHEKAGNLWANCLLWAVMANKSHVAHSWSGFCLHTKIKAYFHFHGYNGAMFWSWPEGLPPGSE